MTAPQKRAPSKRTTKAAAPRQSQRERLLGRPRPSLPYRLLIDPERVETARQELAKAQQAARQLRLKGSEGTPEHDAVAERVDATEAAVDACYEAVILRALPPTRVVELEGEHPPTAEQIAKVRAEREQAQQRGEPMPDWPSWDDDTYWPALLAECAENDMTADDWAEFLAQHVSGGESAGLKTAALNVNLLERVADSLVVPKGWTPTIS